MDDGRITDSQGRTVDFKNTIIILTSNLGSNAILEGIDADGKYQRSGERTGGCAVETAVPPEFLNRLDEIVFYRKPLTRDEIGHIVDLQIADLQRRLTDKQLRVELTPAAKTYIMDSGYDQFTVPSVKTLYSEQSRDADCKKILQADVKPRETLLWTTLGINLL